MLREIAMILFVTCSTLGSQLLVKHAVQQIALRQPPPTGASWLLAALTSPAVLAAIFIQGIGFMVWVVVVSRVKLGLAFAISGSCFYLLIALASWYLYGEKLSLPQWLGIGMVSAGVLLLATSARSAS